MLSQPSPSHIAELRWSLAGPAPTVPTKYLWDRRGARLHRARGLQPEFYPARVEAEILASHAATIAGLVEPREVVDLSVGASRGIRPLLDAMLEGRHGFRCGLLGVDRALLVAAVLRLAADYPRLDIRGAVGDGPAEAWRLGRGGGRLLVVASGGADPPDPEALAGILSRLAGGMEPDDVLLLPVDMGRDPARLTAACDDAAGVSAAFHRNALEVVNRRFGADFDARDFAYEVAWDSARGWLETRLRPRRQVRVTIPAANLVLALDADRPLRTGRLGTWSRAGLRCTAEGAGLVLYGWLTDPDELRAVALLRQG